VNNPAGEVTVSSSYDGLNRVVSNSHPYIGSNDKNDVYEKTNFDGLGRSLGMLHPDGQTTQVVYGANVPLLSGLSSQQGAPATYGYGFPLVSMDEAGNKRQEWIDGFGHVIEVDEPGLGKTPGQGSVTISGSERYTWGCGSGDNCGNIFDMGTVSVVVNGHTTSVTYGLDDLGDPTYCSPGGPESSDTASVVTLRLATAINNDAGSFVTAVVSGSSILLVAKTGGAATNYTLSTSSSTSNYYCGEWFLGTTSFPSGTSGSTLTGGSDNVPTLLSPLVTLYQYNTTGELVKVVQGSQTRTFAYDGLSRLTQETTPEAGTVTLSYVTTSGALCSGDPSKPCSRTAPAPNQTGTATVTTTYTYDTANRLTKRTHSDTTGTVTYSYKTGSQGKGQLASITDPSGSETYQYDALKRVTNMSKKIGTTTYTTQYNYNRGSQLTKVIYPSGRVVAYNYDHVGHLCQVATATNTSCSATSPYLTLPSSSYDAAGRPLTATYGNGVVATAAYFPQTFELSSLSYVKGTTTLFGLNYYYQQNSTYCPTGNAVGNNGQIQCIADVSLGTGDPGRSIAYTYDQLGRLLTANTTGSTQYPAWGLSWTYDRYSNRTAQSITAGSGYNSSLVVNPANNQITSPAFIYDAAGNVMTEPSPLSASYTHDGEECNTGYSGNGNTATYTCDGNHLRVTKVVTGTNAVTTVSIRSGGQVIAEYDNGAAVTSPTREYLYGSNLLAVVSGSTAGSGGTIIYQHRDHLSPRLYTDVNGNNVGEQGTFPFGESWYNNNTTSNWVFTSYERDQESGNDYALARSYANGQGRFMAPDPLEGVVGDPQSWNRYAYVDNDPINLSDPSGQGFWEDLGLAIADIFLNVIAPGSGLVAGLGEEGAGQVTDSPSSSCAWPCVQEVPLPRIGGNGTIKATTCPPDCSGDIGGDASSGGNATPVGSGGSGDAGTSDAKAGNAGPGGGGTASPGSGGSGNGSPAPGGGGNNGPVLYPAGAGKPYLVNLAGWWGKDWLLGHMGRRGTCCSQTSADKKTKVILREQFNGKGPWKSGGEDVGGFKDLISPEAKTIRQQFYLANGQQVRVVLGYDHGKLILTSDVNIVVHGGSKGVLPTYSPF
jgi:RHS repeat-associated protein